MGSFDAGTRELGDRVGHGMLEGKVEVSQVYAASQHEGGWVTGPNAGVAIVNHPRGGGPKYLEQPLLEKGTGEYPRRLAARALEPDGLRRAMIDNMEDLARQVSERAPVEFEDLRRSGHPTVTSDGALVYDRPPEVPRLSDEELRAKKRLSSTTDIPEQLGHVRGHAAGQAARHAAQGQPVP